MNIIFYNVWIILLILLSGCSSDTKSQDPVVDSKPNIIYIVADDLGYGDLSCYGQQRFQTPNIDRIAKEGMLFTDHYAGTTVCAPSRCALMTGMHTGNAFIRGNKEWQPEGQWPIPDSLYTMSEMLKEAGYKTGAFGKWGLGFVGTSGDPNKQGFDHFFGYNCQRLAHNYYPGHLWNNDEKIVLEGNLNRGTSDYAPINIHREALKFMEENRDTSFFLFYPSVIPHAELLAPEEYMERFRGKFLPEKIYEGVDDGETYRLGPYGSQKESHAAFVAMITILDEQVGEILDLVNTLGLEDNTLIIFTSDNGPHLEGGADPDYFNSNGPFTGYKRDLYEGGIRVPMLAKWKGRITPGSQSDHASAFWDVMPTLADLLDIKIDHPIDGISFLPTLVGSTDQKKHEYLYWEFHERGGRQALRKDEWKIVRYDIGENPPGNTQLFNLNNDPSESQNLADDQPEKLKELTRLMDNARVQSEIFQFPLDK